MWQSVKDAWRLWLIVALMGTMVACNPSPKAKAILADEEIRREICDTFPIIPIQKGDTQITKNYIDHYDTIRDAYCAA